MDPQQFIGQQIDQYRIEAHIARGGMADVFLARDVSLDRQVAFKILLSNLAQDPQFKLRFQREAQVVARLNHPNIVQVYNTGLTPFGQPYIAMQYIPGGSLGDLLRRWEAGGKVAPAPQSLAVVRHIAAALTVAHQQGIVHRDLKPSNVLIRPDGTPVLVDLGIAAVEGGEKLTQTGSLIGTPHYMSPEQVRGLRIDGRSDIYSLGVILYEMLAGIRPFEADESIAILHKQVYEAPTPIEHLRAGLSQQTLEVVGTCMRKDPNGRYQTAEDLVRAIDQALQVEGQQGYLLRTTVLLPEGEGELISKSGLMPAAPKKKSRTPMILGIVAALVLFCIVGGYLGWQAFGSEPSQPNPLPQDVNQLEPIDIVAIDATNTPDVVEPEEGENIADPATETPLLPEQESPTDTPEPSPSPEPPTPTWTPEPPTAAPEITLTSTFVGRDGITMRLVPAGEFLMGSTSADIDEAIRLCNLSGDNDPCSRSEFDSESPQQVIYLSDFYIDETEVTNDQYRDCVNSGACNPLPSGTGRYQRSDYYDNPSFGNYPVVWVSWFDAQDYCRWADKRLPTEAEWEKAARGVDGRIFPWGNSFNTNRANTQDRGQERITPVGSYPTGESPYGVLDMAGNIWEYVADWFNADYYRYSPSVDPPGPPSSPSGEKVLRSGSYANYQHYARIANRGTVDPDSSTQYRGIRCARSADQP